MADPSFRDNPWAPEFWNLTRQGEYVRKYGVEVAKTKARQAGAVFGASATRPSSRMFLPGNPPFQVIVQRRNIGVSGGGGSGGLIGAGSSGDGPPTEGSGNPGGGNGLIGAGSSGDGPPV